MADNGTSEDAEFSWRHDDAGSTEQRERHWETYDEWAHRVDERRIHQSGMPERAT